MEKNYIMCDTNIFIHWFNNDKQTIEKLEKIGLDRIAVSVVTVMELIEGVDNKEQLQQLKKKIKHYAIVDFSNEVSSLALQLVENYKLSQNIKIPDAIIAATKVVNNIPLFTYNTKDFNYIPKIELI
jgi:predicted nucleic acid-binding protein